jgi:His-Xaa-Ser system radical SAM maturase HxsB
MSRFKELIDFAPDTEIQYRLLPFRFSLLNDQNEYVLSNAAGEFVVISRSELQNLVDKTLPTDGELFQELQAKHFVDNTGSNLAVDLLALKLRTRLHRIADFTALHMIVVTLRCDHSCPYCQVSRQTEDRAHYDLSPALADKTLDFIFRSPSPAIKIEFQGGESLLNFEVIKYIVLEAKRRNRTHKRNLGFVAATNLSIATDEMLEFFAAEGVDVSTSLDGPRDIHNKNRPRPGKNSYEKAVAGIHRAREFVGKDRVSALMTTTDASLGRVKDIIDEYVRQGFHGIFLRKLSPYGFAVKTDAIGAYTIDEWIDFYKEGVDYIIELNRNGVRIQEFFASVILKKMLTSEDSGFVDLMSPAGIGIKALIYNYDGSVYASDEARMLAEMGDHTFRLGNVATDSYETIMLSPALLDPIDQSITVSAPMCEECAFEPYCGADPVFHHGIYGDFVGRKPESSFCTRNMATFRYLIEKMRSDPFAKGLFYQWANR